MVAVSFDVTPIAAWRVLTASGELDLTVRARLRHVLGGLLDGGTAAVVVDLTGVTLLDCACVGVLVEARGQANRLGTELCFIGARGRARRVLEITGADAALGLDDPASGGAPVSGRTVEAMLAARAVLPPADPRRKLLRDLAVERCLPLAARLAGHYRQSNQAGDELTQVATVGLLKAVDRYDPGRGTGFLSFAFPTVLGELRRYFRDHAWGVHVPRHLQELRLSINQASDAMTQRLHRPPTTGELADQLGEPVDEVAEALVAAQGYAPVSLSQPVGDGVSVELGDLVGGPDDGLDRVEYHESLRPMMARLPDHEQRALAYRFYGNLTQTQIARLLGVSQMQVSRLQSRALNRLREGLLSDG